MKRIILLLQLLILSVPADAAGVRMKQLEDFDVAIHTIGLNTEVEIEGGCYIDTDELMGTLKISLIRLGFEVAPLKESQLEYAVSIKGFNVSRAQTCGVKILSMT